MEAVLTKKHKRFWEIDFLRGICVILMIFDHFMFLAGYIFPLMLDSASKSFWLGLIDFSDYYWYHIVRTSVRLVIVALFMLLCGISCVLTKSNLNRGIKTCLFALAITIFTYLFSEVFQVEATITFGVIHMLGVSMLIYFVLQTPQIALNKPLERLSFAHKNIAHNLKLFLRILPAIVGIVALAIYFGLNYGEFTLFTNYRGTKYLELISNIAYYGTNRQMDFMSMLVELKNHSLASADYFPIMPYAGVVLAGGLIGELIYRPRLNKPIRFSPKVTKPIEFVGKNALFFYVGHQIIFCAFFFFAVLVG